MYFAMPEAFCNKDMLFSPQNCGDCAFFFAAGGVAVMALSMQIGGTLFVISDRRTNIEYVG